MTIRRAGPDQYAKVLDLIDSQLRPPGARTRAVEDFPLALGRENMAGLYIAMADGDVAACAARWLWRLRTSLGDLSVVGVGSVVTAPAWRGQGLSRQLQATLLQDCRTCGTHFAVLWTDQPDIYRSRGFAPAGVEYHVDLRPWRPPPYQHSAGSIRRYRQRDLLPIHELYCRHPWRVLRSLKESDALYGMPGTQGRVRLDGAGRITAYAFCGKGADFPGYVAEWGGRLQDVTALLADIRRRGDARHVLIPQGGESLLATLRSQCATIRAAPIGYWAVLNGPDSLLGERCAPVGSEAPPEDSGEDGPERYWGRIAPDGSVRPGAGRLAIWGLDSV
jgi:GNAT superfamily N-acetyltransferase